MERGTKMTKSRFLFALFSSTRLKRFCFCFDFTLFLWYIFVSIHTKQHRARQAWRYTTSEHTRATKKNAPNLWIKKKYSFCCVTAAVVVVVVLVWYTFRVTTKTRQYQKRRNSHSHYYLWLLLVRRLCRRLNFGFGSLARLLAGWLQHKTLFLYEIKLLLFIRVSFVWACMLFCVSVV